MADALTSSFVGLATGLVALGLLGTLNAHAASAADEERARVAAQQFKQLYWDCLAREVIQALPRKLSGPDFIVYIKDRCSAEQQQFRVAFIDYIAIKHPDVPVSAHFAG